MIARNGSKLVAIDAKSSTYVATKTAVQPGGSNQKVDQRFDQRGSTVANQPGGSNQRVGKRGFHFTKKRIDSLPSPSNGQRSYYYDDEVRGLAIAVTTLGKKTFVLYRKIDGKPERHTIGAYPDMTIEQ